MPKSLEQKMEDQQKFDNLPEKEQGEIVEEAHEEALEMNMEQREKLQPMYIVYRDNELFQETIPQMVSMLQSMGREVDIKSFPEETEKREIKKWLDDNVAIFSGIEMVCDSTTQQATETSFEFFDKLSPTGFKDSAPSLDSLINKATEKATLGDDGKNLIGVADREKLLTSLDEYKKFFTCITKIILTNPQNIPQKVVIFPDRIADHIQGLFKGGVGNNEVQKVLETLKEAFIEGGIEAEKIFIESLEKHPEILSPSEREAIDDSGNWIIVDRHTKKSTRPENRFKTAKYLMLPESSFLKSVQDAGLTNIKKEDVLKYLEEILKDSFGRKEKEE